jgi:hypothetical protein
MGAGAKARVYFAALGLGLARRRNATDQPRARQVAAATREVYARINASLYFRAQADILARSIAGTPHVAFAEARHFVHTAWCNGNARAADEAGADRQPEQVTTCGRGETCGRLVAREGSNRAARRRAP